MMMDKIMCKKTNRPKVAMGKNELICSATYSANLAAGKSLFIDGFFRKKYIMGQCV